MKKPLLPFLFFLFLLIGNTVFGQKLNYPASPKNPVVDTYLKQYKVTDEYRWLENVKDPATQKWVKAQNDFSAPFLKKLQNKHDSFLAIDRISYFETSHPVKKGKYYFSFGYFHNQGTVALFYQTSLNAQTELLVDPNLIDTHAKISIKNFAVSKNSELLAFQYNRNGTDWTEIQVVSLRNGQFKKDHLTNVKFSGMAWKDDGFFYTSYPRADKFDKTLGQQVYYHKIGTAQEEDKLIFERNNPVLEFNFLTTSDERFFILKEKNEQAGKLNVFYIDYQEAAPTLKPLLINQKFNVNILDSHNGKLIGTTWQEENNGSIVEIDPANPLKWKSLAPKFTKAQLLEVLPLKEKIIAVYQSNHQPSISVFDYSGNILYNLELPSGSSVSGFDGSPDDEEFLFHMTSYTFPTIVYSFNVRTYERKLTEQTRVTFESNDLELKELEATGKDGIKIPMLLVHKKGMTLNGKNPTILSAYGGFGSVEQPSFDPGIVYFVKKGGIFAFANIRGGGDLGVDWAKAGRGPNKQNSFDDFISCAEFLINQGYTKPEKLASTGGSNGGLVVAVAAIQRPDLFKAVVPVVAPLDMLRLENFTVGVFHKDEYGTVTLPESFKRLQNYSPYHNVKPDVNYPAMLLLTSENDDRVPPFHSYKFAALLQNRPAQKNPVYLRIEKNAGHHGAASINGKIREQADVYGFIWEMVGAE